MGDSWGEKGKPFRRSTSTAVDWLTPEQITERMSEVYAIRLLDALDGAGPHVRSHDGRRLNPT